MQVYGIFPKEGLILSGVGEDPWLRKPYIYVGTHNVANFLPKNAHGTHQKCVCDLCFHLC
jgi:hypothetical protein